MMLLLFTVAFSIVLHFFIFPIAFPFLAMLLLFIIDIQGIQIDKNQNKIRNYRQRLWGKTGKWIEFDGYEKLVLELDAYQIKVASFYRRGYNTENHNRFMVSLDSARQASADLLIFESPNYNDSKRFALKLSEKLNVPLEDRFSQRLRESRRRRRR